FQAAKSPPHCCARAGKETADRNNPARSVERSRIVTSPEIRAQARRSCFRKQAGGLESTGVLLQPFLPGGLAAVEDVDVGIAGDARNDAGSGVLPEGEGMASVSLARMAGDRAQPVGIAAEGRKPVVVEEVDRGVDDRFLAVVALD